MAVRLTSLGLVLLALIGNGAVAQDAGTPFRPYAPPVALAPVSAVLPDAKGFLWAATLDGLARFDGFTVTEFRPTADDPTAIRSLVVRSLADGGGDTLWIGTYDGLHRLDTRTGTFTSYGAEAGETGGRAWHDTYAVMVDRDRMVWTGAFDWTDPRGGGLHRLDPATGAFRHFYHDPVDTLSLSHNWVRTILEDSTGMVWVGTWHGLNRLDPRTGRFERFLHDPADDGTLAYDDVAALFTDRRGRLWVGTIGGGLDLFDPTTRTFRHYRHDPADPRSLSSDYVTTVAEDLDGHLWVGTLDGLNRLDPATGVVQRYHPSLANAAVGGATVASVVAAPDGGLWVAGTRDLTRGFLDYADLVGGSRAAVSDVLAGSDDFDVTAVASADQGEVWIGTWGGGIRELDRRLGAMTPLPALRNGAVPDSVASLVADGDRLYLVAAAGEAMVIDRRRRTIEPIGVPAHVSDGRAVGAYSAGLAMDEERVWLLFNPDLLVGRSRRGDSTVAYRVGDGLSGVNAHAVDGERQHWIATGTVVRRFRPGVPVARWTLPSFVTVLLADRHGRVWAGTADGLYRFDAGAESFERVSTTGDALATLGVIRVLVEDARGHLWLASSRQLWELDPASGVVREHTGGQFFARGGGIHNGARAQADGELFLGGSGGLFAVRPERFQVNPFPPTVALTGLLVNNRREAPQAPGAVLELAHGENHLTFEYAGLHFAEPERNRYRVRLTGAERAWRDVGAARSVTYPGLPAGTFTLHVMAANASGVWSEPATLARLTILPPWWRTWWAYAAYALLLAAGLWGIRRYEMGRIVLRNRVALERAEADKLRELDRVKSTFFEDMSHEFRTPLAVIQGQLQSLLDRPDEEGASKLRMAVRNARRMQHLTDQILDLARIEAGSVALEATVADVVSFLRSLVAAFESLAASRKVHLSFMAERDWIPLRFDPERLEMAVTNLVSNGLKFTREGGAVAVTVRTVGAAGDVDARVEIEVADTGIGIPAADLTHVFDRFYRVEGGATVGVRGSGVGLALARELIALHDGTLHVTSQEGVGSRFVARFPLPTGAEATTEAVAPSSRVRDAVEAEQAAPTTEALRDDAESGQAHELVLVIEDNPDMRAFLRQELEGEYRVLEVVDGAAGVARARETIPDLILTDVMMPGMDGHEVAKQLRADPRTSHVPIIMLTARASTNARIEGLESGVDEYLPKPFSSRLLRTRIRNLLDLRRLLRERYKGETWIRPADIEATDVDRTFLERMVAIIEERMGDPAFSVEALAGALHLSPSQLTRKVRALIEQTPGGVIRSMRLHRAADLLKQNAGSISEIAYRTGFADHAHFSRAFKARYGVTPSEYRG